MEAVCASESLVYFNETTRLYMSETWHLPTRRRKNLKSQNYKDDRQAHEEDISSDAIFTLTC
jgi:hypothetical protein